MKQEIKVDHNEVGRLGEDIACKFLIGKGFEIVSRNYRKKWGEIDIVAKKAKLLRFVEVKSVSREILTSVTRETDDFRPEDNLHPLKLKRLSRAVQSYLAENNEGDDIDWQFDAITVVISMDDKKAIVKFVEDLIL